MINKSMPHLKRGIKMAEQKINRLMTKVIPVRLNDEQHERVRRAAAAVGLGVSTYMRQLAVTQTPKRERV